MDQIFEPDYAGVDKNIIAGALALVVLLVSLLVLYLNKQIDRNYRALGLMLLGFCAMIALGVITFSSWTLARLTPVTVTADFFESPYGTIPISDIRRTYIQLDQPGKGLLQVTAEPGVHYLVVEPTEGVNHILSEVNYPISEIKEALDVRLIGPSEE